jgi:hypothetical protein
MNFARVLVWLLDVFLFGYRDGFLLGFLHGNGFLLGFRDVFLFVFVRGFSTVFWLVFAVFSSCSAL